MGLWERDNLPTGYWYWYIVTSPDIAIYHYLCVSLSFIVWWYPNILVVSKMSLKHQQSFSFVERTMLCMSSSFCVIK